MAVGTQRVARDHGGGRVEPQSCLREPREVRVEFLAEDSFRTAPGGGPKRVADTAGRVEYDSVRIGQFRHQFREFDGGGGVPPPRRLDVTQAELFGGVGAGSGLDPVVLVPHRGGEVDSGMTVQVFEHVPEQSGDLRVVAPDGDGPPQGVLPVRGAKLSLAP